VLLSFIVVAAASCATEVFPVEKEPVHGESAWGVYLVTDDDPSYSTASATAIDRLTDQGYHHFAFGVELSCDQGSAAALGKPDGTVAVAVYFASETNADAFATAYSDQYGDSVAGVANVTTFCLD
jgi:hypothetical protein